MLGFVVQNLLGNWWILGIALVVSSHLQNLANKRAPDASRPFAEISSIMLALVRSDGSCLEPQTTVVHHVACVSLELGLITLTSTFLNAIPCKPETSGAIWTSSLEPGYLCHFGKKNNRFWGRVPIFLTHIQTQLNIH